MNNNKYGLHRYKNLLGIKIIISLLLDRQKWIINLKTQEKN